MAARIRRFASFLFSPHDLRIFPSRSCNAFVIFDCPAPGLQLPYLLPGPGGALMSSIRLRAILVAVLRSSPDTSQLFRLNVIPARKAKGLLAWLDQSGLSLYLYRRLQELNAYHHLSPVLREELEKRSHANRRSVDQVWAQFVSINESLRASGIGHTFLKGFSLVPDFCPDRYLRHYSDIDVLVPPARIDEAVNAVRPLGYEVISVSDSGEVKMSLPERVPPSRFDSVFDVHSTQMLEFHPALWESMPNVALALPDDFASSRTNIVRGGVTFPALRLPQMFALQLLHAFRHFLDGYIRPAWLFEISNFLAAPRDDEFWNECCETILSSSILRDACGLVLALVAAQFGTSIPKALQDCCLRDLPLETRVWAETVGIRWSLSDLGTNNSTLLVHGRFVSDPSIWRLYLRKRLLPLNRIRVAVAVTRQIEATTRDTAYVIWRGRITTRLGVLSSLPIDMLRWRLALMRQRWPRKLMLPISAR